jgi:diguanylate cyclase (GGDEF)-like protein
MSTQRQSLKKGRCNNTFARLVSQSTLKKSGLFNESSGFIPTLTFLSGEALGKELPLIQQQITLGRGEESDVLLMDPSVSRKHVKLSCRRIVGKENGHGLRVVLQDLDSKNGTLINYRKVRRAVLKPGDKICLGRVILKFEYRDLADQNFYEEIYRLATTDSLTGLLNKAAITRAMNEEMAKSARYHRQLSVVLMDLDDFKSLNDTFGHLIGDRTLQHVAEVLRRNMRHQDKAGRFGGEEFLLVLPETGLKGAALVAERVRADIEKSVASELNLARQLSVSAGVSAYPMDGRDCENLLEHADVALYRAKALGKNRIELWKETQTSAGTQQE